MARISPQGKFRALDANGDPLAGGKLYTYEAGTSTPKATYTDSTESTANANPVILDSEGYADVWLASGGYKFVLHNSADVEQWTTDNIIGEGVSGLASSIISTATGLAVSTDNKNNMIICTASLTLSLLAAATAGEGFAIVVKNTSTGAVTIDPNGSETIDGAATFTLNRNADIVVVCDGTNWRTYALSNRGSILIEEGAAPGTPASGFLEIYAKTDGLLYKKDDTGTESAIEGGTNGAFHATRSTTQSITQNVATKVQYDTEVYDTDGDYDNATNYRFTPTTAGKYLVYHQVSITSMADGKFVRAEIWKNGAAIGGSYSYSYSSIAGATLTSVAFAVFDMNGTTDYVEAYVDHNDTTSRSLLGLSLANYSHFGAIRVA